MVETVVKFWYIKKSEKEHYIKTKDTSENILICFQKVVAQRHN